MQQVDLQGNAWELGIENHYTSTQTRSISTMSAQYIYPKWRPIEEYNNGDYDWVLVRYYDGDYECIPCVAERRKDGKWYDRDEVEIPFEVRYFFDMQTIGDYDGR